MPRPFVVLLVFVAVLKYYSIIYFLLIVYRKIHFLVGSYLYLTRNILILMNEKARIFV